LWEGGREAMDGVVEDPTESILHSARELFRSPNALEHPQGRRQSKESLHKESVKNPEDISNDEIDVFNLETFTRIFENPKGKHLRFG